MTFNPNQARDKIGRWTAAAGASARAAGRGYKEGFRGGFRVGSIVGNPTTATIGYTVARLAGAPRYSRASRTGAVIGGLVGGGGAAGLVGGVAGGTAGAVSGLINHHMRKGAPPAGTPAAAASPQLKAKTQTTVKKSSGDVLGFKFDNKTTKHISVKTAPNTAKAVGKR